MHCRGAFIHLLGSDVFDVGGERPGVAEWIFQGRRKTDRLAAAAPWRPRPRPASRSVDVVDVNDDVHRHAADRFWAAKVHLRMLVGEHDRCVADPHFGVADPAVRHCHAHHFFCSESLLIKLQSARAVIDAHVRCCARNSVKQQRPAPTVSACFKNSRLGLFSLSKPMFFCGYGDQALTALFRSSVLARIRRVVSRGTSHCGNCPESANQCRRASGNSSIARLAWLGKHTRSFRPQPITSGYLIEFGGAPR